MLYILSGALRSGKSIIADNLMARGIPFFSTDFLMIGIHKGCPEFGVDAKKPSTEITPKIWPIVKEMAQTLIKNQSRLSDRR